MLARRLRRALAGASPLNFWLYDVSSNTTAKTVTITAYDPASGLVGSQTLQLPNRTVLRYSDFQFNASGQYFSFIETQSEDTNVVPSYVHVYDARGGVGGLQPLAVFSQTASYSFYGLSISPNGKRMCVGRAGNYGLRIFDTSASFSAPTQIAQYSDTHFSTFGPRGGNFTPSGTIITGSGSSESGSFVPNALHTTYTSYRQAWNGENQSIRLSNFDGTKHIYGASSPVGQNYSEFIYRFSPTGTSQETTLGGVSGNTAMTVSDINRNEGKDGLPYIIGFLRQWVPDSWQFRQMRVLNYRTGAIVFTSANNANNLAYWPNGLIHYTDVVLGNRVLDPSNGFADITSKYASAVVSTIRRNYWPKFGRQTLYTTF